MRCAMRKTIKSEKLNNCMTASRDGTSRSGLNASAPARFELEGLVMQANAGVGVCLRQSGAVCCLLQEVRNVHCHGAGRTIDGARHAVPTFIVRHVSFLCEVAYAQHIERTHVDANSASFVRDAFVVVDDNWNCRGSLRQWHACFLPRVRGDQGIRKSAMVGLVANLWSKLQG